MENQRLSETKRREENKEEKGLLKKLLGKHGIKRWISMFCASAIVLSSVQPGFKAKAEGAVCPAPPPPPVIYNSNFDQWALSDCTDATHDKASNDRVHYHLGQPAGNWIIGDITNPSGTVLPKSYITQKWVSERGHWVGDVKGDPNIDSDGYIKMPPGSKSKFGMLIGGIMDANQPVRSSEIPYQLQIDVRSLGNKHRKFNVSFYYSSTAYDNQDAIWVETEYRNKPLGQTESISERYLETAQGTLVHAGERIPDSSKKAISYIYDVSITSVLHRGLLTRSWQKYELSGTLDQNVNYVVIRLVTVVSTPPQINSAVADIHFDAGLNYKVQYKDHDGKLLSCGYYDQGESYPAFPNNGTLRYWKDGDGVVRRGDMILLDRVSKEITFTALPNVYSSPTGERPAGVPDSYVKVTFDPTSTATNAKKTYYYVNPNFKVKLTPPADPVSKYVNKKFFRFGDGVYERYFSEETLTAVYKDILVDKGDDAISDPAPGYVRVIFSSEENGRFAEEKDTKVYWVLGETTWAKAKSLGLAPPQVVKFEDGFIRANPAWKPNYDTKTASGDVSNITFRALYNEKFYVLTTPTSDPDYVKVTFLPPTNGKGTLQGRTEYWLLKFAPWKDIIADPSFVPPTILAPPGYIPTPKNEGWDKRIPSNNTKAGAGPLQYTAVAVPKKYVLTYDPNDPEYKKFTFKSDDHSRINDGKNDIVYYILTSATWGAAKDTFDIGDLIPSITPDVGYKVKGTNGGWDATLPRDNEKIENITTTTYKAQTEMKTPVFEGTNPGDGDYVKISFDTTDRGYFEKGANPSQDVKRKDYYVLGILSWDQAKEAGMNPPTPQPNVGWKLTNPSTIWQYPVPTGTTKVYPFEFQAMFTYYGDIIPDDTPDTDNDKPTGYQTVYFSEGDHGSFVEPYIKKFYFFPNKNLKVEDIYNPPIVKADTGFNYTGWDKTDVTELTDGMVITAQYQEIPKIVPIELPKPIGYVTVTFMSGTDGHFTNPRAKVTAYVNPKAGTTVGELTKPDITSQVGYTFIGWDRNNEYVITSDLYVTAKYAPDVIQTPTEERTDTVPDNYYLVELDPTDKAIEGMGKRFFYVSPDKEVTIPDYLPTGRFDTARQVQYQFNIWKDRAENARFTRSFTEQRTVYTAEYKEFNSVVPGDSERPKGFVKVTFDLNGKGHHNEIPSGRVSFYVKPNVGKKLVDTNINMDRSAVVPDSPDYRFLAWQINGVGVDNTYPIDGSDDILVIASYSQDDVVPAPDGAQTPYGKVRITFDSQHGAFSGGDIGTRSFFVTKGKPLGVYFPTGLKRFAYNFVYWTKTPNGNTNAGLSQASTFQKDEIFYAKWTPKTPVIERDNNDPNPDPDYVRVVFDATEGHFGEGTTSKVKYFDVIRGGNLGEKYPGASAVRDQYNLKFWTDDGASTDPRPYQISEASKFYDSITLYAIWAKKGVTVTFHYEDGYTPDYRVPGSVGEQLPGYLQDPERSDYHFYGFFTQKNGKGDKLLRTDLITQDMDVYAYWLKTARTDEPDESSRDKYVEVVFRSGEHGRFTGPNAAVGEKKSFYILKDATWREARKVGLEIPSIPVSYIDIGWSRNIQNEGWDHAVPNNGDLLSAQDAVLVYTAKYDAVSNIVPGDQDKPYGYITVTFDLDGKGVLAESGKALSYHVNPLKNLMLRDLGVNMTASAVSAILPYEFLHWDKDAALPLTGTHDIKVIAQYSPADVIVRKDGDPVTSSEYVRVIFDPTGGRFSDGTVQKKNFDVRIGAKLGAYYPDGNGMTKENHFFGFWSESNGGTASDVTADKEITSTVTYYAHWNLKPAIVPGITKAETDSDYALVKFQAGPNGSLTGEHKEFSILKGQNVKLQDITGIPTPKADAGYVFSSWDTEFTTVVPNVGITVTAEFEHKDAVVTGNNEDPDYVLVTFLPGLHGSLNGETVFSVLKNSGITLANSRITAPTISSEKYFVFKQWDKLPSFVITDQNVNVTAEYERQPITVVFHHNYGGEPGQPADILKQGLAGETLQNFPASPTESRAKYRFAGWNTRADGKGDSVTASTIFGDIREVYAIWRKLILTEEPVDYKNEYVTLTFKADTKGSFADGQKVDHRYVLKNTSWDDAITAGLTIPKIPTEKIDVGYKLKDAPNNWSPNLPTTSMNITEDTFTAQYEAIDNIIPGNQPKPYGYITVTFDLDGKGKLEGFEGKNTKSFHVNPVAQPNVTLGQLVDNMGSVVGIDSYTFKEWQIDGVTVTSAKEISGSDEISVNAVYNNRDVIIPGPDETPEAGRVRITFDPQNGSFGDGAKVAKKFDVTNGKALGAYFPEPSTMHRDGYDFKHWSETVNGEAANITRSTTFSAPKTFHAVWSKIVTTDTPSSEDMPKYAKITFNSGDNGIFEDDSNTKTYYVLKNHSWADALAAGMKVPNVPSDKVTVGFERKSGLDAWNPHLPTDAATLAEGTYTAAYNKLNNIIPSSDRSRPHGYIEVVFNLDNKGRHAGIPAGVLRAYVNPAADPRVKLGEVLPNMLQVHGENGFNFIQWEINGVKALPDRLVSGNEDILVIATYDPRDVIIPVPGESVEDGRVRVIFHPQSGKFGDGSIVAKTFDVRIGRPLGAYFPAPETMTREGYLFSHWSESAEGPAADVTADKKFQTGANYFAVWKNNTVRVTFNYNYKSTDADFGSMPSPLIRTAYKGEPLRDFPENPTREGYVFVEWNTNALGTGETVTSETRNLTDGASVYAVWDKIVRTDQPTGPEEAKYVKVSFLSGDEGTFSDTTKEKTYYVLKSQSWEKAVASGMTVPSVPTANIKVGYIRTASPNDWRAVLPTSALSMTEATYTAQYTKINDVLPGTDPKPYGYITVTFDLDGKGELAAIPDGTISFRVNPEAQPKITYASLVPTMDQVDGKDGYGFVGWTHGGLQIQGTDEISGNEDIYLRASYNPRDVIIPAPGEQPEEGRVRITFHPEGGMFVDGSNVNKVFDVSAGKTLSSYFPAPAGMKKNGYDFKYWSLASNGESANINNQTAFHNNTEYYAVWEQIVRTDEPSTEDQAKYATVVFKSGAHGVFADESTQKTFYVLKTHSWADAIAAGMTVPEIPVDKIATGYERKAGAAEWQEALPTTALTIENGTYTAQYTKINDFLPGTDPKPHGYITVIFDLDGKGTLAAIPTIPGRVSFHVNPVANSKVTLGQLVPTMDQVKAIDGYTFLDWRIGEEKVISTKEITENHDLTVVANYSARDVIIPAQGEEPAPDRVRVTFNPQGGQFGDGTTTAKKFDVLKGKTLGAYFPSASGMSRNGYEFRFWTENITVPSSDVTNATPFHTPKAYYAVWDKIVREDQPTGDADKYVKIVFKSGDHGSFEDSSTEKTYYVLKDHSWGEAVAAGMTVPEIPVDKITTGYERKAGTAEWQEALPTAARTMTEAVYTAQYTKIADHLPATDPKPHGYIDVTFDLDGKGTLRSIPEGKITFHVNPEANPKVSLGQLVPDMEGVLAIDSYTFVEWQIAGQKADANTEVRGTSDIKVIAAYSKRDVIIPGPGENPETGRVRVTFHPESGSFGDGSTAAKSFDVAKTKALGAYFPEGSTMKREGYDFKFWSEAQNGENADVTRDTTFTETKNYYAVWSKIVTTDEPSHEDLPKYATVVFKSGEHGAFVDGSKEKTFYVLKNHSWAEAIAAGMTVPEIPVDKIATGYERKAGAAEWQEALPTGAGTMVSATYTAQYTKLSNFLPGNNPKPHGYIDVTFDLDGKGTLNSIPAGRITFHVNPLAEPKVTLGQLISNMDQVKAIDSYTFVEWQIGGAGVTAAEEVRGANDITVIAVYSKRDVIIPGPGEQPEEGRVRVTFHPESGSFEDGSTAAKSFDVAKGRALGAYFPEGSTMKREGYDFKFWSETQNGEAATVTNSTIFQETKNYYAVWNKIVREDQPTGADADLYATVVFKSGEHGTFADGSTEKTFYVLKNHSWAYAIAEGMTVPEIPVDKIATGYERKAGAAEWQEALPTTVQTMENGTYTAQYTELNNFLPGNNPKPHGYIDVTFDLDGKGTLNSIPAGSITFHVNPVADPKVTLGALVSDMANVKAIDSYTFVEWQIEGQKADANTEVQGSNDIKVIAVYSKRDVIIPGPGENPEEGRVRVTFHPESGSFEDGSTAAKSFDVAKTKSLGAYFPEGSTMKREGYDFKFWSETQNGENAGITRTTTFNDAKNYYAFWSKIVTTDEPSHEDLPKYATVVFKSGEHGTFADGSTEKTFYVLKTHSWADAIAAGMTVPEIPVDKIATGYERKTGTAEWQEALPTGAGTMVSATYTAQYTKLNNFLPGTDPKPHGYIDVTFDLDGKGTLNSIPAGRITFHVNPLAEPKVTLGNLVANMDQVKAIDSYTFVEWQIGGAGVTAAEEVRGVNDITVIAVYSKRDVIIPSPGEQPEEGRVRVTFHPESGSFGDGSTAAKSFDVAKGRALGAYFPEGSTMKREGYDFKCWSETKNGEAATVTNSTIFQETKNYYAVWNKIVREDQPTGADADLYATVVFKSGEHGTFADGSTEKTFYVLKTHSWADAIAEGMTVPEIPVDKIATGYERKTGAAEWQEALPTTVQTMENGTYTAQYTKINDFLPGTDPKPHGYIDVTFDLDGKGTLNSIPAGRITFHVNPVADPKVTLGQLISNMADVKAIDSYRFKEWQIDGTKVTAAREVEGTTDVQVIAVYNVRDVIIPAPGEEPESGRVRIIFHPESGFFGDGMSTEKTFDVTKGRALEAYFPEGSTMKREGYDFKFWSETPNGENAGITRTTTFNDAKNYYAVWSKIVTTDEPSQEDLPKYATVVFKSGEHGAFADGSTEKTFYVLKNHSWADAIAAGMTVPEIPVDKIATGYERKAGTAEWQEALPTTAQSMENGTYTAQYTKLNDFLPGTNPKPHGYIDVTFDLDGKGTLSTIPAGRITFHVNPLAEPKVTLGNLVANMDRVVGIMDYTFLGWEKNGVDVTKTTSVDFTTDTLIVAKYDPRTVIVPPNGNTPVSFGRVRITFMPEGGMFGDQSTQPKYFDVRKGYSLNAYFPIKEEMKRSGMNFQYWSLTQNGTEEAITKDTKFDEAKTFYAVWKDKPTVIERENPADPVTDSDYVRVLFLANEGSFGAGDAAPTHKVFDVLRGKSLGNSMPQNPVREEYDFTFWSRTKIDPKASDVDGTTEFYKDTTFYAQWKKQSLTVTFKLDYEVTDPDYSDMPDDMLRPGLKGERLTAFPADPKRSAFDFVEWNTRPDASGDTITNQSIFRGDKDVYAIWRKTVLTEEPNPEEKQYYSAVIFKSSDNATFADGSREKTFYVTKGTDWKRALKADLQVPEIPEDKITVGYERKSGSEAWNPVLPETNSVINGNETYTAVFDALEPIINGNDPKPRGYITVSFNLDGKGTHPQIPAGRISFHVNPIAGKTLGDLGINMDASEVERNTLVYNFLEWRVGSKAVTSSYKIEGTHDIKVIAAYTPEDVIPTTKTQPKPKDYARVGFEPEGGKFDNGQTNGQYFFVHKDKMLGIYFPVAPVKEMHNFLYWGLRPNDTKDSGVNANSAFTGDITYYAVWEKKPGVVPGGEKAREDKDYTTVTFAPGLHGSLEGQTVYSVLKNQGIEVGDASILKPSVIPEENYKHTSWDTPDSRVISSDPVTVTAVYKPLVTPNIVPGDEDYVRVNFLAGEHGKLQGRSEFYVFKNSGIQLGDKSIVKPLVIADKEYEFTKWDTPDTTVITDQDLTVRAEYKRIVADVSFNPNYPDAGESITRRGLKGQPLTNFPKDPKRPDYRFIGWNTSKDGKGEVFTDKTPLTDDMTVYAIWKKLVVPSVPTEDRDSYVRILFNSNTFGSFEGGKKTEEFYVLKDTSFEEALKAGITIPKIPENLITVGYERKTGDGAWDPVLPKKTDILKDGTYTAQYTKLSGIVPGTDEKPRGYVSVSFDLNGKGEHKQIPDGNITFYVNPNDGLKLKDLGIDMSTSAVTPDRGYHFLGWNKKADTPIQGTRDILVIAQYDPSDVIIPADPSKGPEDGRHRISFHPEGGTFRDGTEATKFYDVYTGRTLGAYMKEMDDIHRFAYNFLYWSTEPNGGKADITSATVIRKDVNYYAVWEKKSSVVPGSETAEKDDEYTTVSFRKGDHGTALTGTDVYSVLKNQGTHLGDPSIVKPVPVPEKGYGQIGWDQEDSLIIKDQPVVVTAVYRIKVVPGYIDDPNYIHVTFKGGKNGGVYGQTVFSILKRKGTTLGDPTIVKPEARANEGYKFTGWSIPDTTVLREDTVVYARFASNQIQITYKFNYGVDAEGEPKDRTVSITEHTSLGDKFLTPSRESYVFEGWYLNKEGTGRKVGMNDRLDASVTLYAKWSLKNEARPVTKKPTLDPVTPGQTKLIVGQIDPRADRVTLTKNGDPVVVLRKGPDGSWTIINGGDSFVLIHKTPDADGKLTIQPKDPKSLEGKIIQAYTTNTKDPKGTREYSNKIYYTTKKPIVPVPSPGTGDSMSVWNYAAIMMAAGILLIAFRRREEEEEA